MLADEIVIQASIETRAKTAADACKDNREKSRSLLEFLKSHKIEELLVDVELLSIREIQPQSSSSKGRSLQANADPFGSDNNDDPFVTDRQRPVGYTAYRRFTIVVKDLKKFEEIYQGIVEKGVNRVDGVYYRSSEEKAHIEKIRQAAVRVAKERAEAMASELGANLSAIKSISGSRINSGSHSDRGMAGGYGENPFGTSPSTSNGSHITLESTVDVVFILGDTKLKD